MRNNHVCPIVQIKTDKEVREMVSRAILPLTLEQGLDRLALNLGVNEKTVRRARDQEGTVTAQNFVNLFLQSSDLRTVLLAQVGERPMPMRRATDTISALPAAAGAVHQLAVAHAEQSDGGAALTHQELLAMEAELIAAHTSIGDLLALITETKREKAA